VKKNRDLTKGRRDSTRAGGFFRLVNVQVIHFYAQEMCETKELIYGRAGLARHPVVQVVYCLAAYVR
jgi:hypothetical protein